VSALPNDEEAPSEDNEITQSPKRERNGSFGPSTGPQVGLFRLLPLPPYFRLAPPINIQIFIV